MNVRWTYWEQDGDSDGPERMKNALFITAKPLTSRDGFVDFLFKIQIQNHNLRALIY